jgi:hypothetical protein
MGYAVSSSDSQTAQRLGWSITERVPLPTFNFHEGPQLSGAACLTRLGCGSHAGAAGLSPEEGAGARSSPVMTVTEKS